MVLRINTSIARKLVFQAVVISLFTIVITMVITLESTKDIILQQTSDQLQDEATISGISIQNILDSRETHAHILANEFEIKQLVLKLNSTKYESTIDSDKMFLSYMTEFESVIKNAEIDNIIISDGNSNNEIEQIDKTKKYLLITGIANPQPIYEYLAENKIHFAAKKYSDHHSFSKKEIQHLIKKSENCDAIITTEKDWMRLKETNLAEAISIEVLRLSIGIKFVDSEQENTFNKLIKSLLD